MCKNSRIILIKVLAFRRMQEFKKGVTKEAFIKNTSIPGVTEWKDRRSREYDEIRAFLDL